MIAQTRPTQSAITRWWQAAVQPITERVATFSAENNLAISASATGLAAASMVIPPLQLLAVPSLALAALPAYRKMVCDWRAERQIGQAALEASLVTLVIATNHLTLGGAGMLLLRAGGNGQESDGEDTLPKAAISLLALPVAGLSGVAAALYAASAHHRPRYSTTQYLREHNIQIHNWLAARKLANVEVILLDESCLVTTRLDAVHAFHHRLPDDVAWYAQSVAPVELQHQLHRLYPALPHGTVGADVQLLTHQQLHAQGLTAQQEAESYRYVVLNRQVIGALAVTETPMPAARQLLAELRQRSAQIILLSSANVATTEHLLDQFALDEAYANMGWQQKVALCRQHSAACFISRTAPSAQGLADVAIALSAEIADPDITLSEADYTTLSVSMTDYANERSLRRVVATAPLIVTVGGVFFLHWGLPAALAVQGGALVGNHLINRLLRRKKARSEPAPTPQAASFALAG